MNLLLSTILIASPTAIICPKYLPGTNALLPDDAYLTHEQTVSNLMRCYCEVVVPAEHECRKNYYQADCTDRTDQWVRDNIISLLVNQLQIRPPPTRQRIISIDP